MFDLVFIEPEYVPPIHTATNQGFVVDEDKPKKDDNEKLVIKEISVDNLEFHFKGRTAILTDITFKIKKGQIVALVGETGCGKNTILQILQKFLDFSSGNISIDGKTWDKVGIYDWRQVIASVPQKIKLFNCSLIENIHLGHVTHTNDKTNIDSIQILSEDVIAFCKKYGFDNYFESLPQGYMTLLGEDGINLSGGQQQIVAFARALYQKPQLLLLDEATSAMDRNTELFVLDILKRLKSEMAILMVTHRNQLADYADVIYMVQNGKMNLMEPASQFHRNS